MTAKDFVRTESYALRLRPTGARKMTEEGEHMVQQDSWVSGQRADVELCDGAEGQGAGALSDQEEENASFQIT